MKTKKGFNIDKGEILSCGMMPSSSSNKQSTETEQAAEPVTTSAPQSLEIESEIPKISFCDVDDLNSHYNNQNLRFNCGKKACTGQFLFKYFVK